MEANEATTPMVNLSEIKGLGIQNQTFLKIQMATTNQTKENKDSMPTSKTKIGDDDLYDEVEFDDSTEVTYEMDYTTQY